MVGCCRENTPMFLCTLEMWGGKAKFVIFISGAEFNWCPLVVGRVFWIANYLWPSAPLNLALHLGVRRKGFSSCPTKLELEMNWLGISWMQWEKDECHSQDSALWKPKTTGPPTPQVALSWIQKPLWSGFCLGCLPWGLITGRTWLTPNANTILQCWWIDIVLQSLLEVFKQ